MYPVCTGLMPNSALQLAGRLAALARPPNLH